MKESSSQLVRSAVNEILAQLRSQECDGAIPLGVSNRHIHLSRGDLDVLFGVGYNLTELRPLSQSGQYAAKETICVAGYKGCLSQVRVLGPLRPQSQIEISRTDAYTLGVKPPLRPSGNLAGAVDLCVIGPAGMLVMQGSTIIAQRHIHMTPGDAERFCVRDKDVVSVKAKSGRTCVFEDVVVRVSPDFRLELHLDTDEANAADLSNGNLFTIHKVRDG